MGITVPDVIVHQVQYGHFYFGVNTNVTIQNVDMYIMERGKMSCQKHKQRKRRNCPECFPKDEKTSREMLADAEKEVDQMAIKPQRSKKIVDTNPHLKDPEKRKKMIHQSVVSSSAVEGIVVDPAKLDSVEKYCTVEEIALASFEEKIQAIADRIYARLQDKIDAITDIRYEHLAVPAGILTVALLNQLEKDGWKWAHYYDDLWNTASGLNDPHHHLLVRTVNKKWPKAPDYSKQLKESKKEKGKK